MITFNPFRVGGCLFLVGTPLHFSTVFSRTKDLKGKYNYFNYTKNRWEYTDLSYASNQFASDEHKKTKHFDREEVIRIDSGIYSDNLILSNLHTAIKPANSNPNKPTGTNCFIADGKINSKSISPETVSRFSFS